MLDLTFTVKDIILFLLGTIGIIGGIYLCGILYNIYHILKNVRKLSNTSKVMAEKVQEFVLGPINFANQIGAKAKPFIESAIVNFFNSEEEVETKSKKSKKK